MSARIRVFLVCCGTFAVLVALLPVLPPPTPRTAPVTQKSFSDPVTNRPRAVDETAAEAPAPRPRLPLPAGAVRAFGATRFRPISGPFAVSPDGTRIVGRTNYWDGEAVVWNLATGRRLARLSRGDESWFSSLWFSRDGASVLAVGSDNSYAFDFRRYDAATGKELERCPLPGVSLGRDWPFCLTRDGASVFAVLEDRVLVRRDVRTGQTIWDVPLDDGWKSFSLVVSPDEQRLFMGTRDERWNPHLRVFDARTGKECDRINPPGAGAPVFAPDGKTFVVSANNATAFTVFDARTLEPRYSFDAPRQCTPVRFSPDGRLLAAQCDRVALDVIEVATGKHLYAIPGDGLGGFAFTPDSKTLLVAKGGLSIHDAATGAPRPGGSDPSHLYHYERLDFSPDGDTLTAVADWPAVVTTWDTATGRELARFHNADAVHRRLGWSVVVSPGGRFRMALGRDRYVITDANGREVSSFARTENGLPGYNLELSGDGRVLFGGDGHAVHRCDTATGKHLGTLMDWRPSAEDRNNRGFQPANPRPAPSPCGRYVVVYPSTWDRGDNVPVLVYDARTGKQLAAWDTLSPYIIGWSADGGRVAVGRYAHVEDPNADIRAAILGREAKKPVVSTGFEIREMPSGRVVRRTSTGFGVYAISPDLRTFVGRDDAPESDPRILLCETATGGVRRVFRPGERWWHCRITFAPDGRSFATLHLGVPVLLWDARGADTRPPGPPDASGWAKAWDALASPDARVAFHAIRLFVAFPEAGLPVLETKAAAANARMTPPAGRVEALIEQLGADDFPTRETATAELEAIGPPILPALRVALKTSPSPEVRARVAALISRDGRPTAEELRAVRAVEAAEWIATPAASRLLGSWAGGPAGAPLTLEAAGALARLKP